MRKSCTERQLNFGVRFYLTTSKNDGKIKIEVKMETEKILNDITDLPPQAQRQVTDFIAFLKTRYKHSDSLPQAIKLCR